MSVVWGLIIILLISAGWAAILKRTLTETAVIGFGTVMFVLYCFGLLYFQGCLRIGYYVTIGLAAASLAFIIYKYEIEGKDFIARHQFVQGTVLLAIIALFVFAVTYNRHIYKWDEFTLWGLRVKYVTLYDAFTLYDEFTPMAAKVLSPVYTSYPPGSSIWGYFFSVGGFADWKAYFANGTIPLIMLMPFLKDIFSKFWLKRAILLVFGIVFFSGVFASLLVDSLIGVLFGFAALYYLTLENHPVGYAASPSVRAPHPREGNFGKTQTPKIPLPWRGGTQCRGGSIYRTAAVSSVAFMLAISKDTGGLFAIGVCLLILADCLFFNRKSLKSWINSVIPLIIAGFSMLSWSMVNSGKAAIAGSSAIGGENVTGMATGGGLQPWQQDTIKNFFQLFAKQNSGFLASGFMLLIVFIMMSLVIGFANHLIGRRRIGRTLLWTGGLSIGMILYALVLVYTFIFVFARHQGETLMGYDRYILTYQLALAMVGFGFLLPLRDYEPSRGLLKKSGTVIRRLGKLILNLKACFSKGDLVLDRRRLKELWRFTGASLSVIIMVLLCFTKLVAESGDFISDFKASKVNRPIAASAPKWVPYLREDSLPVFVLANTDEYDSAIYEIIYAFLDTEVDTRKLWFRTDDNEKTGHGVTRFYYNVVNHGEHFANDMCTLDCTPDEWAEFLRKYGYGKVYVYYADEQFREDFGVFFSDRVQNDMLYDIEFVEGWMKLTPVV